MYAGDPDDGQEALGPFTALGEPVIDLVDAMPYPGIYKLTEGSFGPTAGIVRSVFTETLDRASVAIILEGMRAATSPMATFSIRVLGGAMARVPARDTAFAHRDAKIMVTFLTPYVGDAAPHLAWTEMMFEVIRPAATGVYSNFLEDEGEDGIREAYPVDLRPARRGQANPRPHERLPPQPEHPPGELIRSPRRRVDGRVARWRPGRFVIRSASSYMRPTTWPSGSAKSAIVVSGATSVSGTITRPPAASTFASTAFGSSAWT